MGTNFYLNREDSRKYILPLVMDFMVSRMNAIAKYPKIVLSERNDKFPASLKWFENMTPYFSPENYCDLVSDSGLNSYTCTKFKEYADPMITKTLNDGVYQEFLVKAKDIFNKKDQITIDDLKPLEEMIFENVVCNDEYGAHILKRSAAGCFCFHCNQTLHMRGVKNLHGDGYQAYYEMCPECGGKGELTCSITFQWNKYIWMKIFKNVDKLTIYDEYGSKYTKTQFLDNELGFMKKACPNDPWKYQLIFEEEHSFY